MERNNDLIVPEGNLPEEGQKPVDAKITVTVYDRGMRATIRVSAPENGGRPLDEILLLYALDKKRVKAGLDEALMESILLNPIYNEELEIAKGLPPENGVDGTLEYLFDTKVTLKPTESPDGTVNYRELGLIQHVNQGQVLVIKTPATSGVHGYNVMGLKLPARNGHDPKLPVGKNTVPSEDGLQLLAAVNGHVEMIGGKVTVLDTYVVRGDVGTATGNINFDGSVVISGSVMAGFVVQATNNITINGACEAASLFAGGSIVISEGMNGGSIEAKGDVKSKYLQSCRVQAGGKVYAGTIINCTTYCTDTVSLSKPRGTIFGGSCVAGQAIEADYIGSESTYALTKIEVGLDPNVQKRLQDAPKELDEAQKMVESLNRLIDLLYQLHAANRLDDDKQEQFQNALHTRSLEMQRVLSLEEEIAELQEKSRELGRGSIVARRLISPGVVITIGPYKKVVNAPLTVSKVFRGTDGIVIVPAV